MKKNNLLNALTDVFVNTVGASLYAAGIYSFAVAGNFAPGGISGLSIIINHYLSFVSIGLCSLIINIPVVLCTYKTLGKHFFINSVVSMVIVALMLDLVFPHLQTYSGNPLLAALFAGALSGIGLSLIYMRGSSTGGTDFIILYLRKKNPHLLIGNITIIIDGCVLVLNGFVFGNIEAVLYGAILTYISTVFIDKLMYKKESKKEVSIISSNGREIAQAISERTGRGVTVLDATGAHDEKRRQLIIYICADKQVPLVKALVFDTDADALVFVSTSDEVNGRGFT